MVKVTGVDMFFNTTKRNIIIMTAIVGDIAKNTKLWQDELPVPMSITYDKNRKCVVARWNEIVWSVEKLMEKLSYVREICEAIERVSLNDFKLKVKFEGSEFYIRK